MTPYTCPVCRGTGLVSVPPGVAGDITYVTWSSAGPWPCRVCFATGVVWGPPAMTVLTPAPPAEGGPI
jgi:hypothetical protein